MRAAGTIALALILTAQAAAAKDARERESAKQLLARFLAEDSKKIRGEIIGKVFSIAPAESKKVVEEALGNPDTVARALDFAWAARTPGLLSKAKKLAQGEHADAAFEFIASAQDTGGIEFLFDLWRRAEGTRLSDLTHVLSHYYFKNPKLVEKFKPWLKRSGAHAAEAKKILNFQLNTQQTNDEMFAKWSRLTPPLYLAAMGKSIRGKSMLHHANLRHLRRIGPNFMIMPKQRASFSIPKHATTGDWAITIFVHLTKGHEDGSMVRIRKSKSRWDRWDATASKGKWRIGSGAYSQILAPFDVNRWEELKVELRDVSTASRLRARNGTVWINRKKVATSSLFRRDLDRVEVVASSSPVTIAAITYRKLK